MLHGSIQEFVKVAMRLPANRGGAGWCGGTDEGHRGTRPSWLSLPAKSLPPT
jgi:hypothetical protein